MSDYLAMLRAADRLYADTVMDPGRRTDADLAEWLAETARVAEPDRDAARRLRRVARESRRLRNYWRDAGSGESDWRRRVDEAGGTRAWRPLLEIALLGLAADPSEELYEEVKARFPVVHHERWMEGVGFAEWAAGNEVPPASVDGP